MTKYQVYHDHALIPWIIEAYSFEPGVVLISPGERPKGWIIGDLSAPPTYINDGVLRFHDACGNITGAFPPDEWVQVCKVEEADD